MTNSRVCDYCHTNNPPGSQKCEACGAPLASLVTNTPQRSTPPPVQPTSPSVDPVKLSQAQENVEKIEEVVQQGRYLYAILWRTVAEAFSIAVSTLLLGIIAGGIERWWLGVLAGTILGIVVGFANKPYWLAAISAPGGVIFGTLFWLPVWLISGNLPGMLASASFFGLLTAALGSRKRPDNGWEKIRPLLGGLGGFLFASLGSLGTQFILTFLRNLVNSLPG